MADREKAVNTIDAQDSMEPLATPKAKIPSIIIGACGEHFVAAYLSGRGLIVAMPRAGVPGCDMMVTVPDTGRPLRIQVKTGVNPVSRYQKRDNYCWEFSAKIQSPSPTLWYAFVALREWPQNETQPFILFVPSVVVSQVLEKESGGKRTFFWRFQDDVADFAGEAGWLALRKALLQTT